MKVVGHLNGRVDQPTETIDGFFAAREELDSVIVTHEDIRALHSTAHQMIDGVGILNSKSAVGVGVIHAPCFAPQLAPAIPDRCPSDHRKNVAILRLVSPFPPKNPPESWRRLIGHFFTIRIAMAYGSLAKKVP
jgi:hypothetical protein